MRVGSTLTKVLALLFAFAMIAAACGGSSDESDGTTDTTTDDGGEDATPTTVVAPTTEPPAEGPTKGGKLVYGMEADSANGWAPYRVSCAISCYRIMGVISDSLFVPNTDGGVSGVLVESAESNADFTEWTLTIRDGITFHDGTPLTGEAVAFNIDTCRASSLTGPALSNIGGVEANGQDVVITMKTPWAPFLFNMAGGQCSYMFSPDWLKSLADVPQRTEGSPFFDAEVAALPADGDATKPVGLGAFTFVSYEPGNGNSFIAERNEDYWRGPNGITGEDFPYLDEVELVVVVDIASRSNGVESGEFSVIHTANSDEIKRLMDNPDVNIIMANDFGNTSYTMLNVAQGDNPTLAAITGAAEPIPMDPEGVNADQPAAPQVVPPGPGLGHRQRPPGRRARWRPGRRGQRAVPSGFDGLPRGHRLPRVRHRQGPGAVRTVQDRCRNRPDLVPFRHHERSVQRRDQRARDLDVERGVRRRDRCHDLARRAGLLHRARPDRFLPGLRLAQPRRDRPRHRVHLVVLGHVVAHRCRWR